MASKKPTQMIVTANTKPSGANTLKEQLEKRAARFGTLTGATTGPAPATKPTNPADAEKMASRAKRFADLTKANAATGTTTTTPIATNVATNPADAERMAKRAARFADIPVEPATKGFKTGKGGVKGTAVVAAAATTTGNDILAKRAARFANMGIK